MAAYLCKTTNFSLQTMYYIKTCSQLNPKRHTDFSIWPRDTLLLRCIYFHVCKFSDIHHGYCCDCSLLHFDTLQLCKQTLMFQRNMLNVHSKCQHLLTQLHGVKTKMAAIFIFTFLLYI